MTMIELLMAGTIVAIIVPIMVLLINATINGFTTFDAQQQIKGANQQLLNNIYSNLVLSKRIFQNTASDNAFLNKISLSNLPSRISTSQLPVIVSSGSLSPNSAGFNPANVGNSLFFVGHSTTSILNGVAGSTTTVMIDGYTFIYYYLTPQYSAGLLRTTSYNVYRWESVTYADYQQLTSFSNTTEQKNIAKQLYSDNITNLFDPSQTSVTNAFYTVNSAGAISSSSNNLINNPGGSKLMINIITGITGGGFRYGIAPNSSIWPSNPKTVPLYATASGVFPAGFEVAVEGQAGGRQVLVRSVIVAQGSMKAIPASDQVIIASATDLW